MQKYAKMKGGQILSEYYVNSQSYYKFKCKNKHTFEIRYSRIKLDYWCLKCSKEKKREEHRHRVAVSSSLPQQMRSIYSYINYRKIILDFYKLTKKNTSSFSYQIFSKAVRAGILNAESRKRKPKNQTKTQFCCNYTFVKLVHGKFYKWKFSQSLRSISSESNTLSKQFMIWDKQCITINSRRRLRRHK